MPNPYAASIGALIGADSRARAQALREGGAARARAIEIGGQAWGGAVQNIGQLVSGAVGDITQQRQQRRQAQQQQQVEARLSEMLQTHPDPQLADFVAILGLERGTPMYSQWASIQKDKQPKPPGTRQVEVTNPDGSKTVKIVPDVPGTDIATVPPPAPKEPPVLTFGAPQVAMVNGKRMLVRPGSDGGLYDANTKQPIQSAEPESEKPPTLTFSQPQVAMVDGKRRLVRAGSDGNMYDANTKALIQNAQPEPERVPASEKEPLVAIVGPDGQSVLVPRSQAVGKRPANAREQGRPVTSGDAGRIADLDTSLNDLATLGSTLTETKDATGTVAAIGAGTPNWMTNLTGWGIDAKKRQGVIDRVKQVIGKALEGGVLRKEDEYKYTKILPTISDNQEVAASKLAGLGKAITQRRSTTLDALADAGYDTSKYEARSATAPPTSGTPTYQDYLKSKGGQP